MTDVKEVGLTRQDSISRKQYAAGEWNNEAQVTACLNRSPVGKVCLCASNQTVQQLEHAALTQRSQSSARGPLLAVPEALALMR